MPGAYLASSLSIMLNISGAFCPPEDRRGSPFPSNCVPVAHFGPDIWNVSRIVGDLGILGVFGLRAYNNWFSSTIIEV